MIPTLPFAHQKLYYPLSQYYQTLFNERIYKLSVSIATTCPNRQGVKGMSVCSFCDEWGSAAYHHNAALPLKEQIPLHREALRKRYKTQKFLVYFQAYTNTFGRVRELEQQLEEALSEKDIVGVVLGTRPDCLPRAMLNMLEALAQDYFVSVELGVQSFDDTQLKFLSRGHNGACSLQAIEKLKQRSNIDICIHLMFGLPGETDTQLKATALQLSQMEVHGVKLHNLHVLKGTPLEQLYQEQRFTPIELEAYAKRVGVFLSHLSPNIAVHRLVAVASRWDELIAPSWVKEKMRPTQFIEDYLKQHQLWQGKYAKLH